MMLNTSAISMAGSLIIGVAYGLEVKPKDDPYVETAEKALHAMAMAGNAGSFLVDYIPIRALAMPHRNHHAHAASFHSEVYSRMVPWCELPAQSSGMEEGNYSHG